MKINNYIISKMLTAVVIIALFAFGDYSTYVYAAKIVAIIGLLLLERKIKNGFHLKWVLVFIVASMISIIWSRNASNSFFYIVWTLQAMGLAVAIGNSLHCKKDIDYILRFFFIAGLILTVRILMRTSIRELGSFRLGTNMGYNANELSLKASIACIAGFYFFFKQEKFAKKIILAGLCIALGAVVLFTGSRKGSIMLIMGVILYNTLRSSNPIKFIRNVIVSVLLFVGFYTLVTQIPPFYNVLGRRLLLMLNMFNANAYVGNSIANRMNLVRIGIDLFKDSPIIGYGIGGFIIASGTGLYAHNNYIELMVDLGIIGTIIYYSMYFYNIKNLIKYMNYNRSLLALFLSYSLMLVVLEYGLITFQGDYAQIIIAVCYACIQIVKNEQISGVIELRENY